MATFRELRPVEVDYATTGPNRTTLVQEVAKPAETLFRILEDGPAWKEWLGIEVEWTSPKPFGIGTTRTVATARQVMDETFLAWDEGRRMAFRFDRSTLPLRAFAEDYVIEPTGDGSCELRWHYAFEWTGPLAPVTSRLFGAVFKRTGRRALGRLADLAATTDGYD